MGTMRTLPIVVGVLLCAPSLASPVLAVPPQVVAIRGGLALEGPQHVIQDGWTADWSLEFPRRFGALGAEIGYARHGGDREAAVLGSHASNPDVGIFQVVATGRRDWGMGCVLPFAAVGLGITYVTWGDTWLGRGTVSRAGLGGWVGAGVSVGAGRSARMRLDGRYHPFALRAPDLYGGGDLGDFFTVGLSLAADD